MPAILSQPNSIRPHELITGIFITNPNVITLPIRPSINLAHLANSSRVLIKQKKELIEILCECEMENKYDILDDQNQVIYSVKETSGCCSRLFCGPLRELTVEITDTEGNMVLILNRPLKCQDICYPCCLQNLSIFSSQGNILGSVQQEWGLRPNLNIMDEAENIVFNVKGPYCPFSCCCSNVEFPIFAADGMTECGMITKQWRGILQETFTDADVFGVEFPHGIDTQMKALLIGATFLIDYMYFEESG